MARNQIVIMGRYANRAEELPAHASLKPGHLIVPTSAGKFRKHFTAGANGNFYVAKENAFLGDAVPLDGVYAADDIVFGHKLNVDDVLQLRVAAGAPAIAKQDPLVSAGDGTVVSLVISNGTLYSSTAASANVTNTVTETAFDKSYTIPANALRVGDVIRVRAEVVCSSTNSTDTLTLKFKIGSTVVIATAAVDVANSDVGIIDAYITIRTIGASGTFTAQGEWTIGAADTTTMKADYLGSTSIDTTATQALTITATWSVANAGNVVALQNLTVELMRSNPETIVGYAEEALDNSLSAADALLPMKCA